MTGESNYFQKSFICPVSLRIKCGKRSAIGVFAFLRLVHSGGVKPVFFSGISSSSSGSIATGNAFDRRGGGVKPLSAGSGSGSGKTSDSVSVCCSSVAASIFQTRGSLNEYRLEALKPRLCIVMTFMSFNRCMLRAIVLRDLLVSVESRFQLGKQVCVFTSARINSAEYVLKSLSLRFKTASFVILKKLPWSKLRFISSPPQSCWRGGERRRSDRGRGSGEYAIL